MAGRILWLLPEGGYSSKQKGLFETLMRRCNLPLAGIFYVDLSVKSGTLIHQKSKRVQILHPENSPKAREQLNLYIKQIKPDVIVCNDLGSLWLITGNQKYSLNLCRGSVYIYNELPVIVVDKFSNMFDLPHGKWTLINDLQKIYRWVNGKQRPEPKFSYSVCKSINEVRDAITWLKKSPAIAEDIETKGNLISCIGYTGLVAGKLQTFVIPFINPTRPGACHWDTSDEEIEVWKLIQEIHDHPNIKIMQNGANYDACYFIRYCIPTRSYYVDTSNLFHSIWTEAPKKLNFIASICLDYVRYWKDEAKGEKEDNWGKTTAGLEKYWRYNALDCYNTFLCARFLVKLITMKGLEWALSNYNVEFSLAVGPCLQGAMTGMRVNRERQIKLKNKFYRDYKTNLAKLRVMVDDPEFNPSSPDQNAQLIYDVLGAQPIKMRGKNAGKNLRSTDEKVLKLIREQHPVYAMFIDAIWDAKKPLNNASKYGNMELYNERFMYMLSASGTETGRLSSKEHAFWVGTQAQNVPEDVRDMCVVDGMPNGDRIFCEFDFGQSDARFVFYEAEDLNGIANMESGKDTHSVHAAHFFKRSYEEIYAAAKAKEEWCVHPTKGIRQNTKRAVHGANFQMAAFTLYTVMGREATIASANALGFNDAHLWETDKLVDFIEQYLLEPYHILYPRLRKWFKESAQLAIKLGNKATCAFGRTRLFFGDLENDAGTQRELSAYYGQGGTAGNINRSMRHYYYSDEGRQWQREGLLLHLQVHDSLLYSMPTSKLHYFVPQIKEVMEQKFTIKGRELKIPVDAKCGFSWGKGLIEYKPNLTIEDIQKYEYEKVEKKYLKMVA